MSKETNGSLFKASKKRRYKTGKEVREKIKNDLQLFGTSLGNKLGSSLSDELRDYLLENGAGYIGNLMDIMRYWLSRKNILRESGDTISEEVRDDLVETFNAMTKEESRSRVEFERWVPVLVRHFEKLLNVNADISLQNIKDNQLERLQFEILTFLHELYDAGLARGFRQMLMGLRFNAKVTIESGSDIIREINPIDFFNDNVSVDEICTKDESDQFKFEILSQFYLQRFEKFQREKNDFTSFFNPEDDYHMSFNEEFEFLLYGSEKVVDRVIDLLKKEQPDIKSIEEQLKMFIRAEKYRERQFDAKQSVAVNFAHYYGSCDSHEAKMDYFKQQITQFELYNYNITEFETIIEDVEGNLDILNDKMKEIKYWKSWLKDHYEYYDICLSELRSIENRFLLSHRTMDCLRESLIGFRASIENILEHGPLRKFPLLIHSIMNTRNTLDKIFIRAADEEETVKRFKSAVKIQKWYRNRIKKMAETGTSKAGKSKQTASSNSLTQNFKVRRKTGEVSEEGCDIVTTDHLAQQNDERKPMLRVTADTIPKHIMMPTTALDFNTFKQQYENLRTVYTSDDAYVTLLINYCEKPGTDNQENLLKSLKESIKRLLESNQDHKTRVAFTSWHFKFRNKTQADIDEAFSAANEAEKEDYRDYLKSQIIPKTIPYGQLRKKIMDLPPLHNYEHEICIWTDPDVDHSLETDSLDQITKERFFASNDH